MTIKRYTPKEVEHILKINVDIRAEYNEYKDSKLVDCSIGSANIHNLLDERGLPTDKMVVQFISDEPTEYTEYIDEEDNTVYNTLIADSLAEAVVIACLEL